MDELRVDITGSNRGFTIATEQTKAMAKQLKRDLEQSTPETWKGPLAMRDKCKEVFDHLKGSQGMGGLGASMANLSQSFGSGIGNMVGGVVSLASKLNVVTVGLGAIAAAGKIAWGSMENAFKTQRDASSLGVSASFYRAWGGAARRQLIDPEEAQAKLSRVTNKIGEAEMGDKSAKKFFEGMGVEMKGRTMEQVLLQIAKAFQEIKDPAEKAHRAVALFGSGGQNMMPVMEAMANKRTGIHNVSLFESMTSADDHDIAVEAAAFAKVKGVVSTFWSRAKSAMHASVARSLMAVGFDADAPEQVKLNPKETEEEKAAKAKAVADHARDLAAAQERNRKAVEGTVNPQTRLLMLMVDLDNLKRKRAGTKDDVERLNLDTDIAAKQKEIKDQHDSMQKTWDKTQKKELADKQMSHIDSLSSMGLFTSYGSVTNPVLDVNRKQLEKLSIIAENTAPKKDIFE